MSQIVPNCFCKVKGLYIQGTPHGVQSIILQWLPSLHITSPHFTFRVAKEAMEKKFGHVWQSVGATKVPTFAKEKPLGAKGKSRRGGLLPSRLPNFKKKVQVQQA